MSFSTCHLMGGLGNQLFQIFTVISYSINHERKFIFEYSEQLHTGITRNTFWNSFLSDLIDNTTNNPKNQLIGSYLHKFPIYQERGFQFNEIPHDPQIPYIKLFGYFQSYKYFIENWNAIKDLIKLDTQRSNICTEFNSLLSTQYNISMHFRLGDYKTKQQYHPIQPYEYYLKSMQHITSNIKDTNYKVIYFCEKEDNDTVNEIINKLKIDFSNISFIKADDNIPDWKQMLLMSCCNSNIIANSSFSWWSAFMNNYPDKYICYPDNWFGPAMKNNTIDLFPIEWHKVI